MDMSTMERVVLLSILPPEGNLTDYRVLRDLKMNLAFTEEERRAIDLTESNGQVRWATDIPKDIDFGHRARELVVEALKKVDEEGKVNEQNFSLFEKFGLVGEGA